MDETGEDEAEIAWVLEMEAVFKKVDSEAEPGREGKHCHCLGASDH